MVNDQKMNNTNKFRNPWLWVPSLYFTEGIPYVIVMTVSIIMYKKLGLSNTDIAFYTSWLYLPWIIKPIWSPFVDIFSTKRKWIVYTQLLISIGLILLAFTIMMHNFLYFTLTVFTLIAFCSATHDISADGFYMLGLSPAQQSAFVGVRNMFYRIAMITGQGALVVLAGSLESRIGIPHSWTVTFGIVALVFIALSTYHRFILPYPDTDSPSSANSRKGFLSEFFKIFLSFFERKDIWVILFFLLFYRFAEAQLVKLASPFLLDARDKGGLELSTSDVGIVYGTVGILALIAGGLLGGYAISKKGLRWWLWPMAILINLPDIVYVYLSYVQPENLLIINIAVAIEQFGYGFGFTAYSMYMIYISQQGKHKTAHFAICTGFMALGMMLPGMVSGKIQELLGYQNFFIWVMISTIPAFVVTSLIKIDPEFGK